jgi:hypothetical protein
MIPAMMVAAKSAETIFEEKRPVRIFLEQCLEVAVTEDREANMLLRMFLAHRAIEKVIQKSKIPLALSLYIAIFLFSG